MNAKAALYGLALFLCVGLMVYITYDILFSKPTVQVGIITELITIPPKAVATYTPLQGRKIGDHAIIVAKQEQWIAIVRNERDEMFQVHCTEAHYRTLQVGESLQYKKYEGEVFHIRYFAHYEDH